MESQRVKLEQVGKKCTHACATVGTELQEHKVKRVGQYQLSMCGWVLPHGKRSGLKRLGGLNPVKSKVCL